MLRKEVIIDDLIYKVEFKFKTHRMRLSGEEEIFFRLTDHFVYDSNYKAFSSDITPLNCFIVSGEEQVFYVLGKINRDGNEEIHIFHQCGKEFSAAVTEYVTGGVYNNDEQLGRLHRSLVEKSREI